MGDLGPAALAIFVIVGLAMLFVGWIAWMGVRAAARPLRGLSKRRIGLIHVIFGVFGLGFYLGAALFGGEFRWVNLLFVVVFIGIGLVYMWEARRERWERPQRTEPPRHE